jgi:hypothetical protein
MRIDKGLMKAATFDPTKRTSQMSVAEMCRKIETNNLSLPLYQRDMSWTLQKCIDLLNYQLWGKAPVSPISINVINSTEGAVPQVAFIDREILPTIERGQYSVVDGQQRLTTNYKAYCNHEDFRNIVLDLGKGQFTQVSGTMRPSQIPVGILLNKDDPVLFKYSASKSALKAPDVVAVLLQIRSKLRNYNYTINSAEDLTEDQQIEWFEVLNNAGSRVSIIQMRFSKLKAHGIDIYKQYTNLYRSRLFEAGYEDFFTPQKTNVSYPIAALNPAFEVITQKPHSGNYAPMPSDTKENQLCNLPPEQLSRCFSMTLDALDRTLDFINDNDLKRPLRIDYINYLLGYFIFHQEELGDSEKDRLIEWIDTIDFTNKSNSQRRDIFTSLIV